MRSYLAIDIGASSGRHIVGWMENGVIHTQEVYRFQNTETEKNGHLCWDMEGLYQHVLAGMVACREAGFIPTTMSIDTWAVDFALLDATGAMVGDLIAYRDARTQGMDKLLEERYSFEELYQATGIAKQPFNTIYQLMAVLQEHPEYRRQVTDFLLVPEYLSYRLTGQKAHEWTNLSTGAMCDPRTHTWAHAALHAADLPYMWFMTRIVEPGYDLGTLKPEVEERVGYDTNVVLGATHDTASAFMAVPAQDQHAAFLSSGTWSLLGMELDQPLPTEESRLAGFTNEGGWARTTRYLKNIMGLWMIQSIRRETNEQYSFAEMAQLAAQSTYPAWVNAVDNRFMAPASMLEEVKAALAEQGAPQPQSLGDVLRAVTMGLAVCYRDAISEMARLTGTEFTSINIVGGGSQNVTLNQMTADVTGLPVFAGPTEGTALGNLASQMVASGELHSLEEFRQVIRNSFDIVKYTPRQKG